jgi:endonuclease-3
MRVTKKVKEAMIDIFAESYKDAKPALKFNSPFELLVAVILSAQCTDVRVNITTGRLFARANTPEKILALGEAELMEEIRDCGLFRNKAKNIIAACDMLCREYGGEVPRDFDELVKLPGVGRKTANVVVSIAFGVPAIAVDTHVFRVANRLKLAVGDTPEKVEEGLKKAIPKEKWSEAHHWLIWHGRKICKARKPLCDKCPLNEICPKNGVS